MSHSAERSKISSLLYAIKEWNKLDPEIRNAKTYASFQIMVLNLIRPIGKRHVQNIWPARNKTIN